MPRSPLRPRSTRQRLRTGAVVTTDDRYWELRIHRLDSRELHAFDEPPFR